MALNSTNSEINLMALLFILETLSTRRGLVLPLYAPTNLSSALVISVGISIPVKNSDAFSASSV